jgi:hypothetical protein
MLLIKALNQIKDTLSVLTTAIWIVLEVLLVKPVIKPIIKFLIEFLMGVVEAIREYKGELVILCAIAFLVFLVVFVFSLIPCS